MRVTHRQRLFRSVKLLSLNDENTYAQPDHGPSKDGGDTVSRGQLRNILDKTEIVRGRTMPIFLLAETPDTELFGADHEFDRKNLKDKKGDWHLPYAEWLAERGQRIERTKERKAHGRRVQENKAAARVVRNLAKITGEPEASEKPVVSKPKAGP